MAEEIYRDATGVLRHEPASGLVELEWLDGSAGMTDGDFMAWLTRFADAEESFREPNLLIDVTRFSFRPGDHVGAWRDEQIIPRYNASGVRKFAAAPRARSSLPRGFECPALVSSSTRSRSGRCRSPVRFDIE